MELIEKKFIDGSMIKVIAMIDMLLDHIGQHLLFYFQDAHYVLFSTMGEDFSPYFITRSIGRIAFPIFCFLIIEGFVHTRNRIKYGRNLLLFAFISEIPWNLIHANSLFYGEQNVFFTLFLGFLSLYAIEFLKGKKYILLLILAAIYVFAYFFNADFNHFGVLFITALYILRTNKMLMTTIGIFLLPSKWIGGLAFIPIAFYNGKRGFIQGNIAKYAFYAFYPVHLLILYFIKLAIFG